MQLLHDRKKLLPLGRAYLARWHVAISTACVADAGLGVSGVRIAAIGVPVTDSQTRASGRSRLGRGRGDRGRDHVRAQYQSVASRRPVSRSSSPTVSNASRILGPTTAGLLTAAVGGGWAIAVDAASFLLAASFFARMSLPKLPPRA